MADENTEPSGPYDASRAPEACPITPPPGGDEGAVVSVLLASQSIAVLGASPDPVRASHEVLRYMLSRGKHAIPVNPNSDRVLNVPAVGSIGELPDGIELVVVFRRPEFAPAAVQAAHDRGINAIWLQSGIRSPQAKSLAGKLGMAYVEDRCFMVEHMRSGRKRL